jgi:hypothetical protein
LPRSPRTRRNTMPSASVPGRPRQLRQPQGA